jgi:hypothetical protein
VQAASGVMLSAYVRRFLRAGDLDAQILAAGSEDLLV